MLHANHSISRGGQGPQTQKKENDADNYSEQAKSGEQVHVEHIVSWNDENKRLFDGDEERFEQERNRLGGRSPRYFCHQLTFVTIKYERGHCSSFRSML